MSILMLWFVIVCVKLGWALALDSSTYFPAFSPTFQDSIDIELQDYDNDITISSSSGTYYYCGKTIANIGDINSDGIDDFAYSCPYYGSSYGGVVFVVFGGSGILDADYTLIPSTLSLEDGFAIYGESSYYLADSIVGNFDYNVDGTNDFLVCSSVAKDSAGMCWVIFGHTDTTGGGGGGGVGSKPFKNIYLNDSSRADVKEYWFSFRNTFTTSLSYMGWSSTSGDVDGDGNNDIIIGSQSAVIVLYSIDGFVDGFDGNEVYLTESKADFTAKIYYVDSTTIASFSWTLSCGYFNGDGHADILVGTKQGEALILWGSDATADLYLYNYTNLSALYTDANVSIIYGNSSAEFGWHVSSLDFNGDGTDDMAIGAYGGTTNSAAGAVYIIFGSNSKFMSFKCNVTNGSYDYTKIAVILGDDITGFGYHTASAGDINNDGYDDILVGGYGALSSYALAHVIYGVSSYSKSLLTSELSEEARGVIFYSSETSYSSYSKYAFTSVGDVNDDGINDIGISIDNLSEVYVIFGSSSYFKMETNKPSVAPTYKPTLSVSDCEYYAKNFVGVAPPTSVDDSISASNFNPVYVEAMAVDSSGNIYFQDESYIRMYEKNTNTVSIVVGGGDTEFYEVGYGGTILGTTIAVGSGNNIYAFRIDSSEDLVFTATWGIYKLSSSGYITNLISLSGLSCDVTSGYDSGPTSASSFCLYSYGFNLGIDSDDNVYFFDYKYFVIRKYLASTKMVYTLAGTGTQGTFDDFVSGVTGAMIDLPYISQKSFDVSSSGTIYFSFGDVLYSYSQTGNYFESLTNFVGLSTGSTISSSNYYDFSAYTLQEDDPIIRFGDDGKLYIPTHGIITRVTISTVDGSLDLYAEVIVGEVENLYDVGFASSGGTNSSLSRYSDAYSTHAGFVRNVKDVCYQGGLYIADNTRFIRYIEENWFTVVIGEAEAGNDVAASEAYINDFSSMAWDSLYNYLYIADSESYQIQRISSDGVFENYVGLDMPSMRYAASSAYFDSESRTSVIIEPQSVAVDSDGSVYFLDDNIARTIRTVSYSGSVITVVGSVYSYNTNTSRIYSHSATSIYLSSYLSFDNIAICDKNLYFVNVANLDYAHGFYIGKFDMDADDVTVLAGGAYCASTTEIYDNCPMAEGGAATSAHISRVSALTVDSNDNVYYFDYSAYIIRKVSSTSTVATIAGTGSAEYTFSCNAVYSSSLDNCYGTSTSISDVSALAVDIYSNVYFGSEGYSHVYKIDGDDGLISQIFAEYSGWSYNGDSLSVTSAYISGVSSLAYDGENLYVGDVYNQLIRKVLCTNAPFTFKVAYSLVGVTASQYNADSATSDLVFKLSFLSSIESEGISGLTTGDISIFGVEDVNDIMANYLVMMLPFSRTLLSSGIKITSVVTVFPNAVGYGSSSSALSAISSAITSSYSSGAFASALSTLASSYNSVLTSATPSTVVSPTISDIDYGDDDATTMKNATVYPTPPYKSFPMLIGFDRDTIFDDWYSAIGTPVIFSMWVAGIVVVMLNSEHAEYQSLFFVSFSVLSSLNMFLDNGNVLASWFVNWTNLWLAIIFSWFLPATYFFVLTIIKNELFPWFVTDYFFGRIIYKNYRVTVFWFWLSHAKGLPLINNHKQRFSFENHDSLPKVIIYILTWLLLIVAQLVCLIPFALWIVMLLPYYIALFLLGIFLFQTKLLINNTLWNTWCMLFTNRMNRYAKNVTYDTKFFNESLVCEFLLQSIPQLIIKFVNNTVIDNERSTYGSDYTYACSTPAVSFISAIILFIRYVVLVVAFNRGVLDVPFFLKFRHEGKTYKYGIKKSAYDFSANKEAREAYLDYWIQVHNNCKADLLYLGTYSLIRYVFFKPDDADNVSDIKKEREPLLVALREKGMRDVSTLDLATDTMSYMLKDCTDMKLYRWLGTMEIHEPLDLLDISEDTLNGIVKRLNNYKIKQIVAANLHIMLLNNLISRDSLLVSHTSTSSKHLSSKFGTNKYRQLVFPLLKIDGQVDLGVVVDEDGLLVSELGEISLKAGIALNDRVLIVNGTQVRTVEEYVQAVASSNIAFGGHHNDHNQVRILVARANVSAANERATSTEDLYNVFRKSTISFHTNRKSIYSSIANSGHIDADTIMKMDDRELLKMFKRIDRDDSGTIEEPELQKFLEELHIGGAKTAKSLMDLVDENGDGEVDKEEFLRMMHIVQGKIDPHAQSTVLDIPDADEVQAPTSPERREYNPFKLLRQHTERIILGKDNMPVSDRSTTDAPQYSQVELTVLEQSNEGETM